MSSSNGTNFIALAYQNPLAASVIILVIFYGVSCIIPSGGARTNAPYASKWGLWEPRLVANFRFFMNAKSVVDSGYSKLHHAPYRFMRTDGDIIVIPPAFLEELQSIPREVANPTDGNMHNLLGHLTGLNILLYTDLHFRVIRGRLTPKLTPAMEAIQNELLEVIKTDYPTIKDGWKPACVYSTLLRTVARTSARAFVGEELGRNPEWLEIATEYTETLFRTVVITRLFPQWTFRLCAYCLPFYWKGWSYVRRAKKYLGPEIKIRLDSVDRGSYDKEYSEDQNLLLTHMVKEAKGPERDPEWLAQMHLVLALASIHTVQMSIVHILFDLAAHPQYIDELREEVESVFRQNECYWDRHCYDKLEKMDSFMRESQRVNPPQFMSFHRIMGQDFTLSDGTILPKHAHICMATQAIQNDPEVTLDPTSFDPLRYYRLRKQPGQEHRHRFHNADKTALNFGFGRNACPGRFFASLEIKVIVTRLLMDFDMKLLPGCQRPANTTVHEFIVPDMKAEVLFRKRPERVNPDGTKQVF